MKELKKELSAALKDLKQLSKKTERLAAKLDKLEKSAKAKPRETPKGKKTAAPSRVKKAVAKKVSGQKAKKMTASDTILNIIKRRKTPIDTVTLKKDTGFKDNNIRMIVYRLKKRGEIKSVSKGVYEKA